MALGSEHCSLRSVPRPPQAYKLAKQKIRSKRYDIVLCLGRGSFAKVYLARASRFLLGEDATERRHKTVDKVPVGVTRQRRSKCRGGHMLRLPDEKVELPECVAIKKMKVYKPKITRQKSNQKPLGSTDFERIPGKSKLPDEKRMKSYEKLAKLSDPWRSEVIDGKNKNTRGRREKAILPRDVEDIVSEIECLKLVRECKFCIYLHDVIQMEERVWLVMEYAHLGDVEVFCRRKFKGGVPPPRFLKFFLGPIMLALNYMHERGMIHRDVKGGNILLTRCGIPKLCDFGLVQKFRTLPVEVEETFAGTPAFAPPEVYINHNNISFQQMELDDEENHPNTPLKINSAKFIKPCFDTWSLALTTLVLLYKKSPWEYTPEITDSKTGKSKRFRKIKFPEKKLTRYLGSQLENEVKCYGYKRLYKRLYLLDRAEVENDEELKAPRTVPTEFLPEFSVERRQLANFLKKCLKLSSERPSIGELLDCDYIKPTIRGWENFNARREFEMMKTATTGVVSKRFQVPRSEFESTMNEVALISYNSFLKKP